MGEIRENTCLFGLGFARNQTFSWISPAAADFLVKKRGIAGIGVDVISFDPGKDGTYATHKVLLRQGNGELKISPI
jgi:kynurenine formamidase